MGNEKLYAYSSFCFGYEYILPEKQELDFRVGKAFCLQRRAQRVPGCEVYIPPKREKRHQYLLSLRSVFIQQKLFR